ncbi:MAG TPA: CoA-transferase [Tepidiformaceae bacterium]|jgi:glutaconate CoA-transferase subunit B
MTRAEAFSEREVAMCTVARMIEDGRTYWAAGGGTPLYSVLLGKKLYAPDAQYITEDGVIAPEPLLPFEPMMTMVASRAVYRALSWGTMNSAGIHAQLGHMDYGVLNTLQVDQHGNINSTVLGEYGAENARRFGGPGGADTIAACCWRTILITDQEKRKFVREVDFISSPGFLDGSPGARERAGLPRDTGPWRVVTPWAVYDYFDRRLRLMARVPWVTTQEILDECEWKPLVADEVEVLEPPTDEEILILRTELDVRGQTTDAAGAWITWDGEKYVRAG